MTNPFEPIPTFQPAPERADYVCIDSETCGLFGPIVLLQWGENDDGPIHLTSIMHEPITETLELIKWLCTKRILGFNLAFDWFKVQQSFTTLMLLGAKVGYNQAPLNHIDEYAMCEPAARDGPCLKPLGAMDLMLHARKGPWQNLMARDPIVVRRVPRVIAPLVLKELEARIQLPDIFFAKRKKRSTKWQVKDIKTADGVNRDFVNVILDFAPSSALKALATHELGLDPNQTLVFSDVEVDRKFLPKENGFAPFALSIGKPRFWNGAWPDVVKIHANHWKYNDLAREYAAKDIEYPRRLWHKWGRPAFDDDDSLLACLAGSTRWKGFAVDVKGLADLREQALEKMKLAPRSPSRVLELLTEVLSVEEQVVLKDSKTGSMTTKKVVLEEIRKLKSCKQCLDGTAHDACVLVEHEAAKRANDVLDSRKAKKEKEIYDKLILAGRFHVSVNVIGARSNRQSGGQVTEGKKIKKSGGLNPQGINKKKVVREKFPLAFAEAFLAAEKVQGTGSHGVPGHTTHLALWAELGFPVHPEKLVGGDFDKFEVCIADAYYTDPQLRIDLTGVEPPCERGECRYSNRVCDDCGHGPHDGKPSCEKCPCAKFVPTFKPTCSKCTGTPSKAGSVKIHAIIGSMAYSPRSYWDVRATDGKDRDHSADKDGNRIPGLRELFPDWPLEHWVDLYTRAKSAFFALIYFGNEDTLANRLGIPKEDGKRVYDLIMDRYPVMSQKRLTFDDRFCPIRQPDGGQVFWTDPDDFVSSMVGFPRFFTTENECIKALYELAEDVPPEWRDIPIKVMRRDKIQTLAGACRSALYGAGFGLQGANKRAAGNHVIQSTGASLTKELQARIWTCQPVGIHPWFVRPMNVHDELPTALTSDYEERVAKIQKDFIAEKRALVPLLNMKWKPMGTWAGK